MKCTKILYFGADLRAICKHRTVCMRSGQNAKELMPTTVHIPASIRGNVLGVCRTHAHSAYQMMNDCSVEFSPDESWI